MNWVHMIVSYSIHSERTNTAIILSSSDQMHTQSGEVIVSLQKMQSKSLQNFAAIPKHKQGANMAHRLENQVAIITGASRGIGLAIAQDLVKGHGGTLELAKTDASGTEFEIRLPKTAAAFSPTWRWPRPMVMGQPLFS